MFILSLELDEKNNLKGFIQSLTDLAGMLDNFKDFFTHSNFKEYSEVVRSSIKDFLMRGYNDLERGENPVLAIIIKDYLRTFFKSIFFH